MKFKRLIVILVGIIIFTLITVIMPATIFAASTTNFSGDLGGLFKRPNFNLTAGSDKYHYFAIGLTPAESGTYSIEVVSTNPAIDTAMFLYDGPFNCAKPTQNLVAADDDGGVGLFSLIDWDMTAGTQYFVVISTYGTGVTGHVDLTASGPGNMDVVEVATVCRGTQSTAEPEPEPWIRGDQKMVCYQAWINSDNAFEFVFWYEYADNNWVRIYDMNGNMVYEVDMPYGDAHFTADLPDGMYTVKTFHTDMATPIQEFMIGKP